MPGPYCISCTTPNHKCCIYVWWHPSCSSWDIESQVTVPACDLSVASDISYVFEHALRRPPGRWRALYLGPESSQGRFLQMTIVAMYIPVRRHQILKGLPNNRPDKLGNPRIQRLSVEFLVNF